MLSVIYFQLMSLSKVGNLRREINCAEVVVQPDDPNRGTVQMAQCRESSPIWEYEVAVSSENFPLRIATRSTLSYLEFSAEG